MHHRIPAHFQVVVFLSGMDGYRPVYIPADTASQFQEIASTNTNNNIETCGILAGKLVCKCSYPLPVFAMLPLPYLYALCPYPHMLHAMHATLTLHPVYDIVLVPPLVTLHHLCLSS